MAEACGAHHISESKMCNQASYTQSNKQVDRVKLEGMGEQVYHDTESDYQYASDNEPAYKQQISGYTSDLAMQDAWRLNGVKWRNARCSP
jgi:hypothetical protein